MLEKLKRILLRGKNLYIDKYQVSEGKWLFWHVPTRTLPLVTVLWHLKHVHCQFLLPRKVLCHCGEQHITFFYSMDSDLFHVLSFDGGETSGLQELCVLEVSWDLN